jgi:2-haloacid dehalogenase
MTPPRALTFDVFGTVVDWRGALIEDVRAFGETRGISADWPAFVDAWKAGYRPGMDAVREGRRPWASVEALYLERLDAIAGDFGLERLDGAARRTLVRLWRCSRPWPDAVPGLTRLKRDYVLSTLSNGDVSMLVDMARSGGLPWDCVLCAEIFRTYKPDPKVYRGAVALLADAPQQVMMVACHNYDLRAARRHGMQTAFIRGRKEFREDQTIDQEPEEDWDVVADDLVHLAASLEA